MVCICHLSMRYDLFTTSHLSFFFFFPPCIFFLPNGLSLAAPGFSMVCKVSVRWHSLLSLPRVLFHPQLLVRCMLSPLHLRKAPPWSVWASKWGCLCLCVRPLLPLLLEDPVPSDRNWGSYSPLKLARWNLNWHCINRRHNGQVLGKTFIFSCYWWPFRSCS